MTRRSMIFFFLCISILILPHGSVYAADTCPDKISAELWVGKAGSDRKVQQDFLDLLKTCLPNNYDLQESVDYYAVETIENIEELDAKYQKQFIDFTEKALLLNAEVGFDSSQHNYAVLYNAEPGSRIYDLVPQNYGTFVKWTKRAAAQKEPRALFNMATRMASSNPTEGFPKDLPSAYIILSYLKEEWSRKLPPTMVEYVSKTMSGISRRLGPAKTKKLKGAYKTFDFASLCKE